MSRIWLRVGAYAPNVSRRRENQRGWINQFVNETICQFVDELIVNWVVRKFEMSRIWPRVGAWAPCVSRRREN